MLAPRLSWWGHHTAIEIGPQPYKMSLGWADPDHCRHYGCKKRVKDTLDLIEFLTLLPCWVGSNQNQTEARELNSFSFSLCLMRELHHTQYLWLEQYWYPYPIRVQNKNLEPPKVKVEVVMECIDGYSWTEHVLLRVCLAKCIPIRFDHGIFRTKPIQRHLPLSTFWVLGEVWLYSSCSLVRRIDEPARYALARPFPVHMHDSHQRELSHQDRSLDQESFSTTVCFTIRPFCCHCHHESTMSPWVSCVIAAIGRLVSGLWVHYLQAEKNRKAAKLWDRIWRRSYSCKAA